MSHLFSIIPNSVTKADLLLIYPDFAKNELGTASYPENQLGLNRLASYLDFKGFEIKLINTTGLLENQEKPEDLADFILENATMFDVLGFQVNSWNISHVMRILKKLKDVFANRLVIFGGPLATAEPEKMLKMFSGLGFNNLALTQGFGEKAVERILENREEIENADGVWSLKYGVLTRGCLQRLSNEEMAELPFLNPKFNTFYQNYYAPFLEGKLKKVPIDTIYGSQGLDTNHGCPFNCSYCSVHIFGHTINEYSPQRVCDELEYLAKETGFFMFTFTNSNLMFLKRQWLIDFCNLIIDRGLNQYITWSGYHHPNTINLLSVDDMKLVKKSGCDQLVIGIQSIEPSILKIFNRHPNTYSIFKDICAKAKLADLEVVIDYIRGVPGENVDVIEEFFNFCIENRVEVREFILKIYPNTEIIKKGLDFSGYDVVPILGDLSDGLDSYAVIPQKDNPKNKVISAKINESNARIAKERKIRLGMTYLTSSEQAKMLLENVIPNNRAIPDRVKLAQTLLLKEMMGGNKNKKALEEESFMDGTMVNDGNEGTHSGFNSRMNPVLMMKKLILAGDDAPPLMKKMQEKLRMELGDEKFLYLKKKYQQEK